MRIVVIGAGTMGTGIAQIAVASGNEAVIVDVDQTALTRGVSRVSLGLEATAARGKLSRKQVEEARSRLSTESRLETAVTHADVVIEAVPEILDLKRRIFGLVASAAPATALLASNTSSLSIAEIAAATPCPDRVVGMHFFNPVPAMKLIEIVHHPQASTESLARAWDLAVALGKDPIVVADSPGFASSRLGVLLGIEAARMLEAGVATATDIDKAMRLGYGHPMGPLELGDLVGLDVRLAIAEHLERTIGPQFRPPDILRIKVREGKLGRKSGEGFYVWKDGKIFEG